MKILYSWLKEYIEIDKSPEQLAEDLSLFGHEVDSVDKHEDDAVLDFEITPNRGDCLSILGMAREVGALYERELRITKYEIKENDIEKNIDVKVSDPKMCPRFTARIIDNIEIKESPKWIRDRLAAYGFRAINNIVDITNYVMVATGQPLHAFDYNKIKNGKMNIRLSKAGEEMMTLDGQNRALPEGAAIIEDDEKIYDLAGIMGGIKSEVDQNTKTIVLQGAIFDPVMIRKASKFLNHQTDASYRYERGVDFNGTIYGVQMATSLILETCKDAKAGKMIDEIFKDLESTEIEYDPERINRLLGTKLSEAEIEKNLGRLSILTKNKKATVPSYRLFDIKIWQDIAEEVARIHGYNNLAKNNLNKAKSKKNLEFYGIEKIKDMLVEMGLTEIYSYSFADKNKLTVLGFDPANQPQIIKPLSPETEYLRPSLLPSLLAAIAKNPWSPDVNIFEVEAVFGKENEKWQLGIATAGKSDEMLKKAREELKIDCQIENVDQKILDFYKIRRPIKYILIDIDNINLPAGDYSLEISENKYTRISKYPPTVRDLAFIVSNDDDSKKIAQNIQLADERILLVELFDEFSSDKFGVGKKNVAYHIWLQDLNSVLSEDTANQIVKKIIDTISTQHKAKLRS